MLAAAGHPQLPALDEAGIQYQVVGASSIGALAADGTVVWLPEPGAEPAVPPGARLLHGSADLPGAGPHGRGRPGDGAARGGSPVPGGGPPLGGGGRELLRRRQVAGWGLPGGWGAYHGGASCRSTHSPNLHSSLIAHIPVVTGRDLAEWFLRLESGPAFLRRDERAHWLADDASISCGYAYAIVHEYEMRRRTRLNGA